MISVDRFDIYKNASKNRKGTKEEKILFWFGVYRMCVYQPGNRVQILTWKETFIPLRFIPLRFIPLRFIPLRFTVAATVVNPFQTTWPVYDVWR